MVSAQPAPASGTGRRSPRRGGGTSGHLAELRAGLRRKRLTCDAEMSLRLRFVRSTSSSLATAGDGNGDSTFQAVASFGAEKGGALPRFRPPPMARPIDSGCPSVCTGLASASSTSRGRSRRAMRITGSRDTSHAPPSAHGQTQGGTCDHCTRHVHFDIARTMTLPARGIKSFRVARLPGTARVQEAGV